MTLAFGLILRFGPRLGAHAAAGARRAGLWFRRAATLDPVPLFKPEATGAQAAA